MSLDLTAIQKGDPLKRIAEKQTKQPEYSPMDPPDAFKPPKTDPVPYKKLPAFLKKLVDEHKVCTKELKAFEDLLEQIIKEGITKEINVGIGEFYQVLDKKKLHHNTKEEKILFPVLQRKLMEKGEHSSGLTPVTALDIMEDDHIKTVQLTAVSFNFFALAARLKDEDSCLIVLDAAMDQAKNLIESMRLHIFREENVIFPLACKYLSKEELDKMEGQLSKYDHY